IASPKGIAEAWLAGPFPDGDEGFRQPHPPELGPIELAAKYPTGDSTITWQQIKPAARSLYDTALGGRQHGSVYVYFRLESPARQRAQLLAGTHNGVKVWHNGCEVWNNDVVRGALPFQDTVPLDLQPGTNDLLLRVEAAVGVAGLYLHYRSLGNVVASLPE